MDTGRISRVSYQVLDVVQETTEEPNGNIFNSLDNVNNGDQPWCKCPPLNPIPDTSEKANQKATDSKFVQKKLKEQERQLRDEFQVTLDKEVDYLKQKFDYILQNEQLRTSYMLRQAHRDEEEKITALQKQMECKNLAGLMYVMCAERTRAKFEKLQIIEKYTNYINMLNDILTDGQSLILKLSRGYKTAAKINNEWQEKMKKVMAEFQSFVFNFSGGTPEQIQFFFDLPKLLKCNAMKTIDPDEDPIEEEIIPPLIQEKKTDWWESLDSEKRPFVVFGDMADFLPPQRRQVLKHIKAQKTAPRRWKYYAFNNMFSNSLCPNADQIKCDYLSNCPDLSKWICHNNDPNNEMFERGSLYKGASREVTVDNSTNPSRRMTSNSLETQKHMGSLIKIITNAGLNKPVTKENLLGARDSMEIHSSTKLREKSKLIVDGPEKDEIRVGDRRTSILEELDQLSAIIAPPSNQALTVLDNKEDETTSLGSVGLAKAHTDSLEVIENHVPEVDHAIRYEKICPMEKCRRMHVDSFKEKLPNYMKQSSFAVTEATFDTYEACSPEQIEVLRERLDEAKKKEKAKKTSVAENMSPLSEWMELKVDVGVQTVQAEDLGIPPCTCMSDSVSDDGRSFKLINLVPIKEHIDRIKEECLHDETIQFNRFRVVGQESEDSINRVKQRLKDPYAANFTSGRLREIMSILKEHPSLCEIFQANTRC